MWSGDGLDTKLHGKHELSPLIKHLLVEIDAEFFRPGEVPYLRGDTTKVSSELGWHASTSRS